MMNPYSQESKTVAAAANADARLRSFKKNMQLDLLSENVDNLSLQHN